MLGSANRDFHRRRTNEMLIATYKMAEKRKDSKSMERAATVKNLLTEIAFHFQPQHLINAQSPRLSAYRFRNIAEKEHLLEISCT